MKKYPNNNISVVHSRKPVHLGCAVVTQCLIGPSQCRLNGTYAVPNGAQLSLVNVGFVGRTGRICTSGFSSPP